MDEQLFTWLKESRTDDIVHALEDDERLVDACNADGVSLFLLSHYYGNQALSAYLQQHKQSLDVFEAATAGNLPRVAELVQAAPGLVRTWSNDGFTALGLACFFGRVDVAKHLLEAGADPNQASRNAFRVAPLHSAAAAKSADIVALLLGHGADPNAKQQASFTALHEAANQGNTAMAALLLRYGAQPNPAADNGKTPYDLAVEKGHADVAALLKG